MEVSDDIQVTFRISCVPGGKSAVLSGITVALGGKANSTGRGSGLKSFIREGQSYVCFYPIRRIQSHYVQRCRSYDHDQEPG